MSYRFNANKGPWARAKIVNTPVAGLLSGAYDVKSPVHFPLTAAAAKHITTPIKRITARRTCIHAETLLKKQTAVAIISALEERMISPR